MTTKTTTNGNDGITLSVVIPNYNEATCLEELLRRLRKTFAGIRMDTYEIIFVDDGSHDHSRNLLRKLCVEDTRIRLLCLSRNFGHQLAITAGLDHSRGNAVLVMDADLQDPPEAIPDFLSKWQEGYDVVYGVRLSRSGESWFKKGTASAFYRLLRLLTQTQIAVDAGDFRLLSRRALDTLNRLRERSRFMRGMVSWIGYPQAPVYYHRDARWAGETRYSVHRMLKLALDAILSFSDLPLRMATWIGFAGIGLCLTYLTYAVTVKVLLGTPVQGWASLVAIIALIGSLQLMMLGVMGQYIGRIYEELKQRPLYVVMERVGFGDDPPLPQ